MGISVITAASGFEQSLDRTFVSNTVVTKEEWQAFGALTLADVLKNVPGLDYGKSAIRPVYRPSIRGLGGNSAEQVKLLIDGRPIERLTDGAWPFGFRLPLGGFKRVEVIRGPGSAIYGADAFGGVINVVSEKLEDIEPEVSINFGAFDTTQLAAQWAYNGTAAQLSLSINYRKSAGHNGIVQSDLQTQLDSLYGTSASLAPGPVSEHHDIFTLNSQWRFKHFSGKYFTWRNLGSGTGVGIAQALDPKGDFSNNVDIYTLDWNFTPDSDEEQFNLTYNYTRHQNRPFFYLFPAGASLPIGQQGNLDFSNPVGMVTFSDGMIGAPATNADVANVHLTRIKRYDDHKVRWQLGYQRNLLRPAEQKNFGPGVLTGYEGAVDDTLTNVTGTEYAFMQVIERTFYFVSLMDEWQVNDQWLLNVGARYDHYADFGGSTNPRVGVVYRVTPKLKFSLYSGSAFRVPAFSEQYMTNNPVSQGNPAISPENLNSAETGFGADVLLGEDLHIISSLFRYSAKDLIEFVFDSDKNISIAQNSGEQKGKGFELDVRYKPMKNVTIQGRYAHFKGQRNQVEPVAGYPRNFFSAAVNWQIEPSLNWALDARWVKQRPLGPKSAQQPLEDDLLVDTTLTYKTTVEGLSIALSVTNLLDEQAYYMGPSALGSHYPQAGRAWRLRFDYQW